MRGQVIGKTMPHGYAGSYARQPDMVVDTAPLGGTGEVPFGAPVVMGTGGVALPWTAGSTADAFWGVAVREVKSAWDYASQDEGAYRPGEAVPVLKRGCVNVLCQSGVPAPGGKVYVRTTANAAKPKLAVGGFEAAEDKTDTTTYTVALPDVQWKGTADANGVAELRILSIHNA